MNLSREAIRRAQDSDEICKLIKKELDSSTIGNLQLSRGYVMEEGVICKVSGEGDKEVTRPLAPRALRTFIMRNYHSSIWACHRGQHATSDEISKRFFLAEDAREYQSFCLDMQGLPDGEGLETIECRLAKRAKALPSDE